MRRTQSASPVSSSSVRCGCQYYQSSDPLPERRNPVGTPPPYFRPVRPVMADHEYEPINPMPNPVVKVTSDSDKGEEEAREEEIAREEEVKEKRRIIRTRNKDQVIIPLHGDSDEEYNPDRYQDKEMSVEEEEMAEEEDRHAPTPSITIESRTEGEVHTSQVDSSQLEQLPLDKAAREKGKIGGRIRSQAGRLRTKLRNMPNIKLPDRPKMKMPERPKFLSERPKFLSERPKFTMPERPKFNMPERPKFLRERPKFTMPERPKFLKERPRFKMPERPKFNIEKPNFTMPKFMKKQEKTGERVPKPTSSLKRPLKDHNSSVRSESGSGGTLFQSFTYPRFFQRKKKDRERRVRTPPPRMESETQAAGRMGTKWVENYKDIKFADDGSVQIESEEEQSENPRPFQERYPRIVGEEPGPMRAQAESASSLAESEKEQISSGSSSARHRAGVIEEISSDEFFVREKGLSREDVDVSRYLSEEIRDAFRAPKNALARLDKELYYDDYDQEEPELQMEVERPKAPERRRGEKRLTRSRSGDSGTEARRDNHFNTFPMRPTRRKQSEPSRTRETSMEKPPRRSRSKPGSRQTSMPSLPVSDRHATDAIFVGRTPDAPKRRRSDLSKREHDWTTDLDAEMVPDEMIRRHVQGSYEFSPVAPVRKTRSRGTSLADEDRTSRGVESLPSEIPFDDLQLEELPREEVKLEDEKPHEYTHVTSHITEMSGYAVVAKERVKPPRPPPPPVRQRTNRLKPFNTQFRTLRTQGINFFFTYPRRAIRSFNKPPVRPVRNYSTLGPSRPPRRNRVFREPVYVDGDGDEMKDEIVENISSAEKDEDERDLQSGDVVEKMKGRPLPPPPRPNRKKREESKDTKEEYMEEDLCVKDTSEVVTSERQTSEEQEEEEEEMEREEEEEEEPEEEEEEPEEEEEGEVEMEQDIVLRLEPTPQGHLASLKSKKEDFISAFSQIKPPPLEDDKVEEVEEIKRKMVNVQQQTSFDIVVPKPSADVETSTVKVTEVTVSVQTDPLPENIVVVEPEPVVVEEVKPLAEVAPPAPVEPPPAPVEPPPPTPRVPTPPPPEPQVIIQQVIPDKIHLAEMDVEKLNVSEIQAQKIIVSDIDGQTMQVSELSSKAGNLVLNGIELPPEFLQSITSQFASQMRAARESTPQAQLRRVVTPPPPIVVCPTEEVVGIPEAQVPQTSASPDYIPRPKNTKSKGRKSPTRVIDDSEDELAVLMPERAKREVVREPPPPPPPPSETRGTQTPVPVEEVKPLAIEPPTPLLSIEAPPPQQPSTSAPPAQPTSTVQLLYQLIALWHANLVDWMSEFVRGVNSVFPEGEKRRDAQTAAVVLLVLIAGLVMIGFGIDNSVHHHHWDWVPPR